MNDKERQKKEFKLRIYRFIIRLIKFLKKLPFDTVTNEIVKQATRSGTSIGANFFEARGASSKKDYSNFFSISLKSTNETCFWLSILIDTKLLNKEDDIKECQELIKESSELANIFAASIITMKGKRKVF